MVKTSYFCDDCLENFKVGELQHIGGFDFCSKCLRTRVEKSLDLIVPSSQCTLCKGKGYTEQVEHYDPNGRHIMKSVPCNHGWK